jgi:transposase
MVWSGTFSHDGWAVYNKFTEETHHQFLAHLLRRCDSLVESGTGGVLAFPRAAKSFMLEGIEYRNRFQHGRMTVDGLKVMAGWLTRRIADPVRPIKTNAANERFARFLEKNVDDVVFFLRNPGAANTNWRGKQAIRPAVVNLKVWSGNRTEAGAEAQATLMSVMRTCVQRQADPYKFIHRQQTSP